MIDQELPALDIIVRGHRWTVINKPAGIGVERHFNHDTVELRAIEQFRRPGATKTPYIGIVHRLDRVSSGCLLFTHNKSTLVYLQQQFEKRQVGKTYWALVEHEPPNPAGRLKHYLMRDRMGKKAIAISRPLQNAKLAELDYKVIRSEKEGCLLEIELHSGRFHQIRAQLNAIGCPIIGDTAYGAKTNLGDYQIALHARQLSFKAVGTEGSDPVDIVAEAPIPEYWPIGVD